MIRYKILFLIFIIFKIDYLFASQGITSTEIRIGNHTALSGPAQLWGVGSINALRLLFDEVNLKGGIHGRKLKLIVEDHQYQVPRAIQAVNKLINRDKVFLIIAALGTPMNNAVMNKLFSKNILNLFPYTSSRSMGIPHHQLKFVVLSYYYDQIRAGIKFFVEKKNKKRICVIFQGTDFGKEIEEAVKDQLKAMKLNLYSSSSHKPTETNFVTDILKHKKNNCDLIIMGTILSDTIRILNTTKKLGWETVDFMGSIASYDQIIISKSQGVSEGFYSMTGISIAYEHNADKKMKEFMVKYRNKYNQNPGLAAQLSYYYGSLLIFALEQNGRDLSTSSLVKTLESIRNFPKPFGGNNIFFGPNKHQGSNESILTQVRGDKWIKVAGPLKY